MELGNAAVVLVDASFSCLLLRFAARLLGATSSSARRLPLLASTDGASNSGSSETVRDIFTLKEYFCLCLSDVVGHDTFFFIDSTSSM